MKWPRLHRADWVLVGILVPLALVAALLGHAMSPSPAPETPLGGESPSTFRTGKAGARAVYLVWGRLGYGVDQLRRTITRDRLEAVDGLVVLSPAMPLEAEEREVLLQWVGEGGRLLLTPGFAMQEWFNVAHWTWRNPMGVSDDSDAAVVMERPQEQLREGDDATLLSGVDSLATVKELRLDEDDPLRGELAERDYDVFLRDEDGVIGLRVGYDRGEILVLGDAYPLTNLAIGDAANSIFAANLAAALVDAPGEGRITFDEYHHGFVDRDTTGVAIVRLLIDEGRQWAAVQALLVAALAVFAAGVRFGRPRETERRVRPTQQQFITAGARLLEECRGSRRVGQMLREHHRRRLCRLLHLPEDADDTLVARTVSDRTGIAIDTSLQTLGSRNGKLDHRQLLRATRELHLAQERLRHGI